MYKKLLAMVVSSLLATSASAAVIKYEMKDVLLGYGGKLGGWVYQSTSDNSILYYDLVVHGYYSSIFGSDISPTVQSAHNYFGGDGPTSFVANGPRGRDDDYLDTLNLQFLPGTGIDILVKGSLTRTATRSGPGIRHGSFAIQYGTVTTKLITDPDEIARVSWYLGGATANVPTVSQADPIQVPEPGSAPLLMLGAAAVFAAARGRKKAQQ